jgi:hypothetical protein
MNAALKMRTSHPCLVPKANSRFKLQQTVPFAQLDTPAELQVTLGRFALLALFHSMATDFALFALPDSSVLIHQQVLSHVQKATIKIRWAQQTALFVLLVTHAKIALNPP